MPDKNIKVDGRNLKYKKNKSTGDVRISIDGGTVIARYDAKSKTYSTTAMPYHDYKSIEELAKSLIASHPNYRKQRTAN